MHNICSFVFVLFLSLQSNVCVSLSPTHCFCPTVQHDGQISDMPQTLRTAVQATLLSPDNAIAKLCQVEGQTTQL